VGENTAQLDCGGNILELRVQKAVETRAALQEQSKLNLTIATNCESFVDLPPETAVSCAAAIFSSLGNEEALSCSGIVFEGSLTSDAECEAGIAETQTVGLLCSAQVDGITDLTSVAIPGLRSGGRN
jgi:hypothetical protein